MTAGCLTHPPAQPPLPMQDTAVGFAACYEAAGVALAEGDRGKAEASLRAAIECVEGIAGSHNELVMALVKLGALKRESGAYSEAEQLFAQALDIAERAWGSHDLRLVPALTGLGTSRIMLGRAESAEPVLTRAIGISEQQLGESDPDLAILLNDLSRLYLKQSAFRFAEPLLTRLLAIKRAKGDDHPEVATVLASLATVHQSLGRHEMAEQTWRHVIDMRERTLAPNHFAVATALENLAETCSARGKLREALQCYQRAHAIRELTLGAEHESLRRLRERIADLQLQASENSLEADLMPAPERSAVPRLETPLFYELEQPTRLPPDSQLRKTIARAAPTNIMISETQPVPSAPNPAAYMNVLMDIQEELEEPAPATSTSRPAALLATATAFFKTHRIGASVVVALALPAIAFAIVRTSGGSANKWATQSRVAVVPQGGPVGGSAEAFSRPVITDPLRDSALSPAKSVGRGSDESSPSKRSAEAPRTVVREESAPQPELPKVTIPVLSQPGLARLDSAVKAATPARPQSAPTNDDLAVTSEISRRGGGDLLASSESYTRARLLGELPVPELPARLRAAGDVVAQFDVDTTGRPVLATVKIVKSPDARLSDAVRKVIPSMRFEPARLPGPRGGAITDAVEITMRFVAKR